MIKIKCDPSRLPAPILEPTRPYHTPERPLLLNIDPPEKPAAANGWTEEEMYLLVALYHRGKGYIEIAENVGRSPQACQAKIVRMGEAKKAHKDIYKWTGDRMNELLTYLRNGMSKKEAAAKMGVTDDQVYGALRRWRKKL